MDTELHFECLQGLMRGAVREVDVEQPTQLMREGLKIPCVVHATHRPCVRTRWGMRKSRRVRMGRTALRLRARELLGRSSQAEIEVDFEVFARFGMSSGIERVGGVERGGGDEEGLLGEHFFQKWNRGRRGRWRVVAKYLRLSKLINKEGKRMSKGDGEEKRTRKIGERRDEMKRDKKLVRYKICSGAG